MSDPYRVNRSYILHLLMWLGIYLGISIGLSLLMPFPMSFIAFLGVFIVIQFVRRYLRSGINRYGGFFWSAIFCARIQASEVLLHELRSTT